MPDIKTQITIVGAGPVGLLLAILLGRRGKDIVLVDKWPEIYNRPRAGRVFGVKTRQGRASFRRRALCDLKGAMTGLIRPLARDG